METEYGHGGEYRMKAGTESKSKFRQLKRRLQLRYWQVVGVLETLWRVTLMDAPAGDIGKLDNEEIAAALEWDGEPDSLINALIDTHWIDPDPEFRLIIHDWSEHAPNHLVGAFRKHHKLFADQIVKQRNLAQPPATSIDVPSDAKQCAKDDARHHAIAPCLGTMPEHHATKPSQTKPSPATPSQAKPAAPLVAGGGNDWNIDSEAHARLALQGCGYKRHDDLIRQCRDLGITPRQIVDACGEYSANRGRFESPGAIKERLRTGHWPAEGVVTVDEATELKAKSIKRSRSQLAESIRFQLIRSQVNEARDWNDDQVLAYAKQNGVTA